MHDLRIKFEVKQLSWCLGGQGRPQKQISRRSVCDCSVGMPGKGFKPVYSRKCVVPRNFPRLGCYVLHAPNAAKGLREFKHLWSGGDELDISLITELSKQCFELALLTVHAYTSRS